MIGKIIRLSKKPASPVEGSRIKEGFEARLRPPNPE
jgi:hypothetical protein